MRRTKDHQLTLSQKLAIVEREGAPNYLYDEAPKRGGDREEREQAAVRTITYRQARGEIRRLYKEEYDRPGNSTQEKRLRVIKRYFSNFPHLAFEPPFWSWIVWHQALASKSHSRQAKLTLRTIADAVSTTRYSEFRARAIRLRAAQEVMRSLLGDESLKEDFLGWKEGRRRYGHRMINRTELAIYEKRHLNTLIDKLRQVNPRRIGRVEQRRIVRIVDTKGLRPAVAFVVSKVFSVRQTDVESA